jgi:carbamoyltransferase
MALADYASPVADADNPMFTMLEARDLAFHTSPPARRLRAPLRRVLWRVPNEQFAFMAQRALERASVALVANAVRQTGERRVALAGGVASNIKVNRRIRLLPDVDEVFVFPHMGDGGLAAGAAAHACLDAGTIPAFDRPSLDYGPSYTPAEIRSALDAHGLAYRECPDVARAVSSLLADGRVVLWHQGGMEFGPRALGHRSVLARPDRPELRGRLNLVLKRRVWYQPFCPSMLVSEARRLLADFTGTVNRHMTMAYLVGDEHRASLAGVINVDGSCRPQMVDDDADGPYAALLRAMRERIGVGAVLNTSLNIHGAPLVCTPAESVAVLLESGADALAVGPFLVGAPAAPR